MIFKSLILSETTSIKETYTISHSQNNKQLSHSPFSYKIKIPYQGFTPSRTMRPNPSGRNEVWPNQYDFGEKQQWHVAFPPTSGNLLMEWELYLSTPYIFFFSLHSIFFHLSLFLSFSRKSIFWQIGLVCIAVFGGNWFTWSRGLIKWRGRKSRVRVLVTVNVRRSREGSDFKSWRLPNSWSKVL